MKKFFLMIFATAVFIACDDVQVKEKDLNAAGEKLQKSVKKGVDTVGSKLKKLKNKLDDDLKDAVH